VRALAVEDDPRIARDLVAALTAAGFLVETATDGETAWFLGDTEDYDLVVLDLGLPRMDGLAALKRWRANGRETPVLILSARGAGRPAPAQAGARHRRHPARLRLLPRGSHRVSRGSLRLRFFLAGAVAVAATLAIAALGLAFLFERHVERRAVAELSARLDQIAAGLDTVPGGVTLARPPADPRYSQPLSGAYWQLATGTATIRSRSLWDRTLPLPPRGLDDPNLRELHMTGPRLEPLLAIERQLRVGADGPRVSVTVAMDRAELTAARRAFLGDLAPYLALIAAALLAAGWVQVTIGLRPLADIGARVASLRSGGAARLGDDFPAEVRPLAAEIDALIEAREADVLRARARAGDLAHALKTPLQALIGEAARLRAAGSDSAAKGIEDVARAIDRHVQRELARARVAGGARAASADPAAAIAGVLSVLRRTPEGRRVDWQVDTELGLRVRIDAADLTEALGALAENAARHARAQVTLSARRQGSFVAVRDDGPGAPPEALERMRARGERLDAGFPGQGLGLAIAADIAEAAGGSLDLADAAPGLEATLLLPAA
jgi:signal transduction histidine kinase/CheY-like chemotaxis protein